MVVGDMMLDEYIYGNAERLSPEAPVPVIQEKYRERRAGGAGNVAADLAVLGAETLCVSIRGKDDQGELLVSLLEKAGARAEGVIAFEDGEQQTNWWVWRIAIRNECCGWIGKTRGRFRQNMRKNFWRTLRPNCRGAGCFALRITTKVC